jgi:AbrB family looped-hinge helix DNA binding protein
MSSEIEIAEVDEKGKIVLPYGVCEKIGIHPHDKLILGVRDNTLILTKQKRSVFDLQLKEVAIGTLKNALIFERNINKAGKKDF